MQKKIRILILSISIVMFLALVLLNIFEAENELKTVSIRTEDNQIKISWNSLNPIIFDYTEIEIKKNEEVILTKEIFSLFSKYYFDEGEHGEQYTVSVKSHKRNGEYTEVFSKTVFFLNYEYISSLPIVSVDTTSGEDPTYEMAEKPDEKLLGESEVNNEYCEGVISVTGEGVKAITQNTKIRTRGNTSTVLQEKNSYKIKLQNACRLIDSSTIKSDEWVLLDNGNSLETFIGTLVASKVEIEWQMPCVLVNLFLNGDYKGAYYLMPSVDETSAGGLVSEDGYIFESTAYWWVPGKVYIKTENQIYQLGYTFKYPEVENSEDERAVYLKNYLQEIENCITEEDVSYKTYIDENSFAKWILVRDITGNMDGAGSNVYYYMNSSVSKIKMGPLWDFDGSFLTYDNWSKSRHYIMCTKKLLQDELYCNYYEQEWNKISDGLYSYIESSLNDLYNSSGEALNEAWRLETKKYHISILSFEEQTDNILKWFYTRTAYMNNELGFLNEESNLLSIDELSKGNGEIKYCIDYIDEYTDYQTLKGWAYLHTEDGDNTSLRTAVLVNNNIYLSNEFARDDLQQALGLENTEKSGFKVNVPCNVDYQIVIVDLDNKIIYGV